MMTTKYYYNKSKAANTGMIGKGEISNTRINDMNATIKDGFQYSSVLNNEIDVIIICSECTKFIKICRCNTFLPFFQVLF